MTAKQKKYLFIAAIVALVLFLVWKFTKKPVTEKAPTMDAFFNIQAAPPVADDSFPLHVGSKGENVKQLQVALNKLNEKSGNHLIPLVVDGSFGEKTKSTVLALVGAAHYPVTNISFSTVLQQSTFTPTLNSAPTYTTI